MIASLGREARPGRPKSSDTHMKDCPNLSCPCCAPHSPEALQPPMPVYGPVGALGNSGVLWVSQRPPLTIVCQHALRMRMQLRIDHSRSPSR